MLPAIYGVEHMVSEIPCTPLVHIVRECAGIIVGAVSVLPVRWLGVTGVAREL